MPATATDLPDLMTLADVLARLRGRIGRTALLQHLAMRPDFAGRPTHGRRGRRYYFTPAQYSALIDSLATPRPEAARRMAEPALPSADRALARARALVDAAADKPKRR